MIAAQRRPRFAQYWRRHIRLGYACARGSASIGRRAAGAHRPLRARMARRNILYAVALTLLFNVSVLCALFTWSLWPLLFGVLLFASSVQRAALQARRKTAHVPTRLLYGLHAHLRQIPLFIGQLNYRTRCRRPAPKHLAHK